MLWSTVRQGSNGFFPVTCCLHIYFFNILIDSLRNGWKGPECKFIAMLLLLGWLRIKHYVCFERDKINIGTLYHTTLPQLLCISTAVMKEWHKDSHLPGVVSNVQREFMGVRCSGDLSSLWQILQPSLWNDVSLKIIPCILTAASETPYLASRIILIWIKRYWWEIQGGKSI